LCETEVINEDKTKWIKDGTTFVDLEICHRKNLIFDELIDERGGE